MAWLTATRALLVRFPRGMLPLTLLIGHIGTVYGGVAITDLGTLAGTYSQAFAINDSGQVVGYSDTVQGQHAFLYSGGTMSDLGTLGGSYSSARGINDSGQAVGFSYTAGDSAQHAFLYSGGTMSDLGTLGGASSAALGINDSGQVVGQSSTLGNGTHAFLYSRGTMTDLNSLLPNGSGWTLLEAQAINSSGQITGYGFFNGQGHAFLLTPDQPTVTPEPSSIVLLGTGVCGLALARRRRWTATGTSGLRA